MRNLRFKWFNMLSKVTWLTGDKTSVGQGLPKMLHIRACKQFSTSERHYHETEWYWLWNLNSGSDSFLLWLWTSFSTSQDLSVSIYKIGGLKLTLDLLGKITLALGASSVICVNNYATPLLGLLYKFHVIACKNALHIIKCSPGVSQSVLHESLIPWDALKKVRGRGGSTVK